MAASACASVQTRNARRRVLVPPDRRWFMGVLLAGVTATRGTDAENGGNALYGSERAGRREVRGRDGSAAAVFAAFRRARAGAPLQYCRPRTGGALAGGGAKRGLPQGGP